MNKLILSLLCVAFALVGCGTKSAEKAQAKADKLAIQSVVDQMGIATASFTNSADQLLKQNPLITGAKSDQVAVLAKLNDDLTSIDISGCPADFRIAFTKYCQALRDFQEYSKSLTGWRGFMGGFLHPTKLLTVSEDVEKAAKPLKEAQNELEVICAAYGVRMNL